MYFMAIHLRALMFGVYSIDTVLENRFALVFLTVPR